jgi:hypothetical protein
MGLQENMYQYPLQQMQWTAPLKFPLNLWYEKLDIWDPFFPFSFFLFFYLHNKTNFVMHT